MACNFLASIHPTRPVVNLLAPHDANASDAYDFRQVNASTSTQTLSIVRAPFLVSFFESAACLSPDGRWVVTRHFKVANAFAPTWWVVWELPQGICRAFKAIPPGTETHALRPWFSADGSRIYFEGPHGNEPWDWSGVHTSPRGPAKFFDQNGLGPDQIVPKMKDAILVRRREGIVDVLDPTHRQLKGRMVGHPPSGHLVAFAPQRHLVAAAAPGGTTWIWDRSIPPRNTGKGIMDAPLLRPAYCALEGYATRSLAWSGNGRWIALGTEEGNIALYEALGLRLPDGTPSDEVPIRTATRELKGLEAPVRAVAFGKGRMAAIDAQGRAALWTLDRETPEVAWQAHPHRAQSIYLSNDGTWSLTGGLNGLSLWHLPQATRGHTFAANHLGVAAFQVDASESWVAVAFFDGTIGAFALPSGRRIWDAETHTDVAAAVAIHPSLGTVVSSGWDGRMVIVDGRTGQKIQNGPVSGNALRWSRDGTRMAVGAPAGVRILDERYALSEAPENNLNFHWDEECT